MTIALASLRAFLVCGLAVAGAACSGGEQVGGRGKDKSSKHDAKDEPEDDDVFSDDERSNGEQTDPEGGGRKPSGFSRAGNESGGQIEYPSYTLQSTGFTTYTGDHMTMTMTLESTVTAKTLTSDVKAAHISCDGVGGCTEERVEKRVRENVLGANVFDIVPFEELKEQSDYKEAALFAYFSKSFRSKKGVSFTADKALPINVIPAAASRYKALDDGPMTWTAKVTADRVIPNSAGMDLDTVANIPESSLAIGGLGTKTFTVTMRMSKVSNSGGTAKIQIETTIAEDKQRMLYTYFPIGRQSIYQIDTDAEDLVGLSTLGWANGSDSHQEEETQLEHRACAKTIGGEVKRNDCT